MITWKEEQSVILDGYNQYKQPSFTYSTDTEVEHSCSIVWNNQMYVFGGLSKVNQISKVENCHLNLVGQLNFRMHKGAVIHNCKKKSLSTCFHFRLFLQKGACTEFENSIFICFPEADNEETCRKCLRATGPLETFQAVKDSTYCHKSIRIANDGGFSMVLF